MNLSPRKEIMSSFPIVGRRRKDMTINARTGSMQEQAYEYQIKKDVIKRTMQKDITPRRDVGMVPRKGGGNVRVTGIARSHDSKKRIVGIAKERRIDKERRQHQNFEGRRWQTGDKKRATCNRMKQGENPITSHSQGRCRSRNRQQTKESRRKQRRDRKMAENREKGGGRWTQSKSEEDSRKHEAREEKGKSIAEELPERIILTIQDESEDDFYTSIYDTEGEGPGHEEARKDSKTGDN